MGGRRNAEPRWDSDQYLKFAEERTLPSRDLAGRIALTAPAWIVDLGCGPGTSTAVLRARWPAAQVTGVDRSSEMLAEARLNDPSVHWVAEDLLRWEPGRRFDLVFSNAALHWVPDHPRTLRRFWGWVEAGGAFAFQVPATHDPPAGFREALGEVTRRDPFRAALEGVKGSAGVLSLAEYYDLFSEEASRVDLWDTEYVHVLAAPSEIVEWVKGTSLRPYLGALPTGEVRAAFLREYAGEVERRYPPRADGRVLFPFLRRFVIAYRGTVPGRVQR